MSTGVCVISIILFNITKQIDPIIFLFFCSCLIYFPHSEMFWRTVRFLNPDFLFPFLNPNIFIYSKSTSKIEKYQCLVINKINEEIWGWQSPHYSKAPLFSTYRLNSSGPSILLLQGNNKAMVIHILSISIITTEKTTIILSYNPVDREYMVWT